MHTAVAMASVRMSLAMAIGWPESRMTAHTSSAPRTALARVASMAAPHTLGSMTAWAPSSAWKMVAATAPPSQNSVTLKATLTGDWPRLTTSTTIGPSRMPSSIAHGSAKMRPKTSGSSLSEKMWTLRRNSTCTTHSSATAKAPASSHHAGRGCGPRACEVADVQEGERQRARPHCRDQAPDARMAAGSQAASAPSRGVRLT